MQSLWPDLRYGMRGIRANPGFSLLVLRMGRWLVAIGLAVGLGASLVANKVLASGLWGVSARDPLTFAAVAVVVLAAGAAACWFPARRATRVDPMIALRFE